MLYEKANMGMFAARLPLDTIPGKKFRYSSGNCNILSSYIRKDVGDEEYYSFPYVNLFYKIGMYNTLWETDASGTYVGSSYIYATARDWARFGLLYLNRGRCDGEQVLPEYWINQSKDPISAYNFDHYGFYFLLNTRRKKGRDNRFFPNVPDDMFYADGFEGQNIFIIPSMGMVIVRLGLTPNGEYYADKSLGLLMDCVRKPNDGFATH